jgi:hypothetical protein
LELFFHSVLKLLVLEIVSSQHHSIERNRGPVTIMMEALPIHIHRIRDAALQITVLAGVGKKNPGCPTEAIPAHVLVR